MQDREVRRMVIGVVQVAAGLAMFVAGLALLLVKGCG